MKAFERLPGRQQQTTQGAGTSSTTLQPPNMNMDASTSGRGVGAGGGGGASPLILPKAGKRPHSLVLSPLEGGGQPKKVNQARLSVIAGSSPKRDRPPGFDPTDLEGEDPSQQPLVALRSPPKHPRERQQLLHQQQLQQQQQGGGGRASPLRGRESPTGALVAGGGAGSPLLALSGSAGSAHLALSGIGQEGGFWSEEPEEFFPTVGDYCAQGVDPRIAVSELEQIFPRLEKHESNLRILPNQTTVVSAKIASSIDSKVTPGALSFEVTEYDSNYFLNPPQISTEGFIQINPTTDLTPRHGTTVVSYRVVDHSNFKDDSLTEFVSTQVESLTVDVVAPTTVTKQLKDWKSFHNKRNATKVDAPVKNTMSSMQPQNHNDNTTGDFFSSPVGGGPSSPREDEHQQAPKKPAAAAVEQLQLPLPTVRIFRRAPPQVNTGLFASKYLRDEPLLLLRCCNVAAERRLLSSCDLPMTSLNPLLEQVKELMKNKAPITQLLPVLDNTCRLHYKAGSATHIQTAQRIAKLRAQCVGRTIGIDTNNNDLLDMSVALRMASTKGGTVQQLIRVLVEGAHLFKNTGELEFALNYYRFAFNLASVVNNANRSASMIPFLVATGDVYLMRGELTQALDCFERARTFAEANGADTVVAECEDLVGLTYALLGHHTDSQNALARSLKIREAADVNLALAESLLFHAYCSALRESFNQAQLLVDRAVGLLEAEPHLDSATKLLLVVAQCIAGWLHLGRSRTSEIRQRLEQAVKLCKEATSEGSAEICIPLWLLQCYNDNGEPNEQSYNEFATVHRFASHHCSEANSFTSAIRMCGALTCTEKEEALLCVETGMAPILLNYDPTYGLLLSYYEMKTVVLLRWRCYDKVQEAVDRLQWIALNGRKVDLLSTGISFRLTPLFAEAYTMTTVDRGAKQSESQSSAVDDETLAHWDSLDALMDTIAVTHSKNLGEFSQQLVPLLLDVAELRYAHKKYQDALSIFGRALKVADQHNIIYLLGQSLFQPAVLLTPQELAARDRLASERGARGEQMLELGTMLFQIAICHEADQNLGQAISTYQKSLAIFEMSDRLSHLCTVATLTGLGRVQLKVGLLGDALANLDRAEDIIKTFHYNFGNYKIAAKNDSSSPGGGDHNSSRVADVIDQHACTSHAVKSSMWRSHYMLQEHTETRMEGAPVYY